MIFDSIPKIFYSRTQSVLSRSRSQQVFESNLTLRTMNRRIVVDRNYAFHWGRTGSSHIPCSETYHGRHPFSEPETKAISDLILANKDNIKVSDHWLAIWISFVYSLDLHCNALVLPVHSDAMVCHLTVQIDPTTLILGVGLTNYPNSIMTCSQWLRKRRNRCRRSITPNIKWVRVLGSSTRPPEELTVSESRVISGVDD